MTKIEFDIIIFHNCCPDGIMGLWTAYNYNRDTNKLFEKIPMYAGKDPYGNFNDKNVIFIDVCPSINFLLVNQHLAKNITILDHHKSAYDTYQNNIETFDKIDNIKFIFDMNRSGCQIAWDYFFKDEYRPWFIDYIADRDLWTWQLHKSREINECIDFNNCFDQDDLTKIDKLLKIDPKDLINKGKIILKANKKIMQEELKNAHEAIFFIEEQKYRVWVSTMNIKLKSDYGNILVNIKFTDNTKPDFAVIWSYDPKYDVWYVSLRGGDDSPDLSVISKKLGGGGHAKAAAFRLTNGKNLQSIIIF